MVKKQKALLYTEFGFMGIIYGDYFLIHLQRIFKNTLTIISLWLLFSEHINNQFLKSTFLFLVKIFSVEST